MVKIWSLEIRSIDIGWILASKAVDEDGLSSCFWFRRWASVMEIIIILQGNSEATKDDKQTGNVKGKRSHLWLLLWSYDWLVWSFYITYVRTTPWGCQKLKSHLRLWVHCWISNRLFCKKRMLWRKIIPIYWTSRLPRHPCAWNTKTTSDRRCSLFILRVGDG